jgi:hypothetical protein
MPTRRAGEAAPLCNLPYDAKPRFTAILRRLSMHRHPSHAGWNGVEQWLEASQLLC